MQNSNLVDEKQVNEVIKFAWPYFNGKKLLCYMYRGVGNM